MFFTSGGCEAVESALKLCRAWHRLNGDGQRIKVIAREIAYHGTTPRRARRPPASPACARPFEPLTPGGCHVPNTNSYRWPEDRDPLWAADAIEERILFEGPETVSRRDPRAGAERRRLLRAAGRLLPARARDLRQATASLLISDEVICSWGRLGH